jgi:hypothetical protein
MATLNSHETIFFIILELVLLTGDILFCPLHTPSRSKQYLSHVRLARWLSSNVIITHTFEQSCEDAIRFVACQRGGVLSKSLGRRCFGLRRIARRCDCLA